jgi:hydroxyacylglutathione hydrolase
MFIQQLYTSCLSEAAYYIESNGEAVIIDPLRDIDTYLQLAKERNTIIKYIFETHFHADFVSGHLDLSKQTGAPIVFGPQTETNFEAIIAKDKQAFAIGNLTLQAIHTPGHTLESTCYLLFDEHNKAHAIFTGDTLFVGDVGRPDLSSGNLDKEELAAIMYDTIQTKILPLADDVLVYPAHGAGSSCGKNLGPNTYSTIGEERASNYALQPQTKEAFIEAVTANLSEAPKYFAINAQINKQGYESIELVIENGLKPLSVKAFKAKMANDVVILDSRNAQLFTEGFVPNSISIGLEGRFADWAGSILPFDKPIILVTEEGKEKETIIRLARVGLTKLEGYLKGSYAAWQKAGEKIDLIINVEADELAMDIPFDENLQIIDVRREAEFAEGHVKNAINMPLNDMTNVALLASIEDSHNNYIHCAGGYRSVIAASIMKKEGIHNIRNVVGGWDKIKEEKKIAIEKDASVLN